MVEKEFLCMKEAAQMLGVNERTMKNIIMNNNIHSTKLNGKILINKNLLLEFLNVNVKIKLIEKFKIKLIEFYQFF